MIMTSDVLFYQKKIDKEVAQCLTEHSSILPETESIKTTIL